MQRRFVLEPMRKRKAKLHDCGAHGMLTVRQIALKAGIGEAGASRRVRDGVRGEMLVAPTSPPRGHGNCWRDRGMHERGGTILVACLFAKIFRDDAPTPEKVALHFPDMSRATQYRWVAAWKAANPSGLDAKAKSAASRDSGVAA